jgi:hypothetical protein
MEYTYEVVSTDLSADVIKRTNPDDTVTFIPMDEANSDYQRYLNPDAEQSTPILPE